MREEKCTQCEKGHSLGAALLYAFRFERRYAGEGEPSG